MPQATPNPITKAAAYWGPAFAGMTTGARLYAERPTKDLGRLRLANFIQKGRPKAGVKLAMTSRLNFIDSDGR